MLLAELTPPPGIATWLACLAFMAVLAVNLGKLWDRGKAKPTPAEVEIKAAERYVLKVDFLAHKEGVHRGLAELRTKLDADSKAILDRLDEVKTDLSNASERRISALHERLDGVAGIAIRAEDRTKHKVT